MTSAEDHVGDAEPERGRVHDDGRRLPGAAERAPCAEYEQHLPGERIEVPGADRVGRQIPSGLPRHQPQHDRGHHGPVGLAQHQPQHRREQPHQHDVERQHVEIDRLEFQEQSLPQRFGRIVDQADDVELVDQFGIAEAQRQIADRGDIDHEQDDVGDIELPDALGQPRGADDEAAFQHHPGIDEGGGIAGNENEQVGGVAEPVIAGGDPVHDVVGDVVQVDRPVRDPAKQVEPEVASFFWQGGVDFHGCRFEVMLSGRSRSKTRSRPPDSPGLSQYGIMTIPVRKWYIRVSGITDQIP